MREGESLRLNRSGFSAEPSNAFSHRKVYFFELCFPLQHKPALQKCIQKSNFYVKVERARSPSILDRFANGLKELLALGLDQLFNSTVWRFNFFSATHSHSCMLSLFPLITYYIKSITWFPSRTRENPVPTFPPNTNTSPC